jgi:hypothetical protein
VSSLAGRAVLLLCADVAEQGHEEVVGQGDDGKAACYIRGRGGEEREGRSLAGGGPRGGVGWGEWWGRMGIAFFRYLGFFFNREICGTLSTSANNATSVFTGGIHQSDSMSIPDQFDYSANCKNP